MNVKSLRKYMLSFTGGNNLRWYQKVYIELSIFIKN